MIRLDIVWLAAALVVTPAVAQESVRPTPTPAPEVSPAARIDELLGRLATTTDEDEASGIVKSLEREWLKSGSDASDLLMTRALQAFGADDYALALQLLDVIVATDPQWAEGWNKRATVRFYAGDTDGSAADVAQTLARNPRHVMALVGLGLIFQQAGKNDDALKVLRRAQKLAPHFKPLEDALEKVKAAAAGQSL